MKENQTNVENLSLKCGNELVYAESMLSIADLHLGRVMESLDMERLLYNDDNFCSELTDSLDRLHDTLGEIASKLVAISDSYLSYEREKRMHNNKD